MQAIDTHCHLSHTIKKGLKLNAMLEHARKNNVIAIIDAPVYINEYIQTIRLHRRYPEIVFATLGAPPANYHELNIDQVIEEIKKYAELKEIVGIGEVGLDYYWVKDQKLREQQHVIFQKFIILANELNLPIVIHSREAEDDAIKDLEIAETDVIMHSFSGSVESALECVDRGYYISIPTSVANRKKNRKIAENVPLGNLITETDSPYLSPFPDIKRNEPANVIYAVKEIAQIKKLTEEEVAEKTTANAIKIFNLPF